MQQNGFILFHCLKNFKLIFADSIIAMSTKATLNKDLPYLALHAHSPSLIP